MKIHIAASERNHHAVSMLKLELRRMGIEATSYLDIQSQATIIEHGSLAQMIVQEIIEKSDLVIYLSNSGDSALFEVATSFLKDVPVVGLFHLPVYENNYQLLKGMMSVIWHYEDMLQFLENIKSYNRDEVRKIIQKCTVK